MRLEGATPGALAKEVFAGFDPGPMKHFGRVLPLNQLGTPGQFRETFDTLEDQFHHDVLFAAYSITLSCSGPVTPGALRKRLRG
jgi:hypothetical protein